MVVINMSRTIKLGVYIPASIVNLIGSGEQSDQQHGELDIYLLYISFLKYPLD